MLEHCEKNISQLCYELVRSSYLIDCVLLVLLFNWELCKERDLWDLTVFHFIGYMPSFLYSLWTVGTTQFSHNPQVNFHESMIIWKKKFVV
jgi:hypothetical protein